MTLEQRSASRCFGGRLSFHAHQSESTATEMRFSVFEPPQAAHGPVPALYFLAGLTCTEETFMIKAGAQRLAAEHGLLLVAPDTSPRGAGLPGEDDDWDFGTGAGFYLDATAEPWSRHYRMASYVAKRVAGADRGELSLSAPACAACSAIRWAATARWSPRCAIPRIVEIRLGLRAHRQPQRRAMG